MTFTSSKWSSLVVFPAISAMLRHCRASPKTSLNHSIDSNNRWYVQRDIINASLWLAFTGNFSFKENNCKPPSLARRRLSGLPGPFGQQTHADSFNVAYMRPRTCKGITDLLLLNLVRLEASYPSKICSYVDSKNPPAEAEGLRDTIRYAYLAG